MCFSLWLKWLRFCCCRECCFWRDQRSQFQKDTFSKKKKNLQWSFEFLSTLCKKVFSGATVKGIFVCGSNNSDSVVFGNTALGDIKDHSLIMTRFEKKNCCGSFGFVSTLHKKVFSGAPVQWVFLYGWNNSDSAVFGNATFGEIKDHSLRMTNFEKKIAMEVLGLCLPYIKRYFQEHQLSVFFFMVQTTQILMFLGKPILQRSKTTVWAQ